jgi:hypothetical protein
MTKPKLVTGLFKNRVAAEAAVDAIVKRGWCSDWSGYSGIPCKGLRY